jgi:hypothetical protein
MSLTLGYIDHYLKQELHPNCYFTSISILLMDLLLKHCHPQRLLVHNFITSSVVVVVVVVVVVLKILPLNEYSVANLSSMVLFVKIVSQIGDFQPWTLD